jgi:hypothetical protein
LVQVAMRGAAKKLAYLGLTYPITLLAGHTP